jgi:hypothetical protein
MRHIVRSRNRAVKQWCRACGAARVLDLDQLEVGILDGADPSTRFVAAPACARCGYVELLIGVSDPALDGQRAGIDEGPQGLLIEPLCAVLGEREDPDADDGPGTGARPPVEEISVWFQRQLLDDGDPKDRRWEHS